MKTDPGAMEPGSLHANPRVVEAKSPKAMKAYQGALPAHPGALHAHPRAYHAHPRAYNARSPWAMEAYPGAVEAHFGGNGAVTLWVKPAPFS
jgi:hypothetical protein